MPTLLSRHYQSQLAELFMNSLDTAGMYAYMFIGRAGAWPGVDGDVIPPTPSQTAQTHYDCWRDMLAARRIVPANAAYVVPRRDWFAGVVYTQYDDQNAELLTQPFYVLDTSATPYTVYKCLWNNNGAPSLVSPRSLGAPIPEAVTSSTDGYVWKYLYSIASDSVFLNSDWMPVLTDNDVRTYASNFPGALVEEVPFIIQDGGAGYSALDIYPITVSINGDGASAVVLPTGVTVVGDKVRQVMLASGGLEYTQVNSISIAQTGVTSPAIARAIIPPYPNHGYDNVRELGAQHVLVRTVFSGNESGNLSTENDFRRIGIVINPALYAAPHSAATANFYRQTWDLTITPINGTFQPDDVIYNDTKSSAPSGTVVDVITVGANTVLRLSNVNVAGETTPFEAGDEVRLLDTRATVVSAAPPELLPYSGVVVLITQRTPVTRTAGQNEDIKIILPFGA